MFPQIVPADSAINPRKFGVSYKKAQIYNLLRRLGYTFQRGKETLRWVHITISNAKRNLLGNYHKIKRKYLQLYLNEFVYKLNRRYFGDRIFDRLVIANITGL